MNKAGFNEQIRSLALIERLMLKRNPLDYRSYIETFRESLIDANPHQIESIIFALEKLENGGCILADEVGLGKTIEAGLVISQYRANRKFNILIIVPTSLAGQWNNELRMRFQVSSRIITSKDRKGLAPDKIHHLFNDDGVYIMGREFASRLQKDKILSKKQWDLIVVDEAHEVFANIYLRFSSRDGQYNEESTSGATAAHLFRLFKRTPILLLTATPLQNNILEIWGLSAYILPETSKSYLGQYNHFRKLFIKEGEIPEDKIPELRERLGNFLIRNLRANAQTFMKYKFTHRCCETVNFNMDKEEKSLYDAISAYLERDDIYAYSTNGMITLTNEHSSGLKNLLKLSYRRVLGSSFSALKESLSGIVLRLEKMKAGQMADAVMEMQAAVSTDDPENDEEDRLNAGVEPDAETTEITETAERVFVANERFLTTNDIANIDGEIMEVKQFIERAGKILETGKDRVLINWIKTVFNEPERFFQKAVIFTTYVATQRHLKRILEENGFQDEIVIFSGGGRRTPEEKEMVEQAVSLWEEEVGAALPPQEKPSGNILERTALVHFFKTRKKIFISTEAGAKGLNLQFCNAIINYDLPWNPQRIEQRIGRCHRYGQERDVWVINCINADNDTEKRIYELLLNKFNLFKSVLGAGDDILGTLSKAIQFEKKINDMMNRFKTKEERLIWLQKFEDEIDEETRQLRDRKLTRTRQLLDELDPNVTARLKNIENKMPESFSRYDKDMLDLLENYALSRGLPFQIQERGDEQIFLQLGDRKYYIGKRDEDKIRNYQHIGLKHPLLEQILAESRPQSEGEGLQEHVYLDYTGCPNAGKSLEPYVGSYGRWDFYNVRFAGVEEEERLFDVVSVAGNGAGEIRFLNDVEIESLKNLTIMQDPAVPPLAIEPRVKEFLNDRVKEKSLTIQKSQQPRLDKKLHNLEVELRDMEEYLKSKEKEIKERMDDLDKKIVNTFDRDAGIKLIKQKETLQNELKQIRKELLNFQTDFQELYDKEQLKLIEKRFIQSAARRIFTLHFQVR
ncbi:MAG: SNF2-related protein [Candidatus Aminicenantes bacterium]|nr:SNF2-related protein [Candidatus Aminicenantes bacterium]